MLCVLTDFPSYADSAAAGGLGELRLDDDTEFPPVGIKTDSNWVFRDVTLALVDVATAALTDVIYVFWLADVINVALADVTSVCVYDYFDLLISCCDACVQTARSVTCGAVFVY